MTARGLAWRTVTAESARAALAIAGVTVIGALLFDMLMLSQGLLVSFREMLDTTGYDVRVVATDAFPIRIPITNASAVAADVALLPEVREVSVVRTERALILMPDRPATDVSLINLSEGAERHGWRLVAGENLGSAPRTSAPPAVISRNLAQALGLAPGSMLSLRVLVWGSASALPSVTFAVVGIGDFQMEAGNEYGVATTFDAFQRARASMASDAADVILVASRSHVDPPTTVAAIESRRKDVRAFSNEQIVERFNENGFAYFRQISFVLSTITLGFAFLLVATLLTVSVNQRLGQVAALRALGVPRRRVAATLLWESALLVGAGGLLSLPAGWVLSLGLDRILRDMPNIPDRMHFFVFEPRLAAWHLGLLAATGVVAAVYPVWVATRLPIAATLRFETVS